MAESLRSTLSRVNAGGSLDEVLDFIVAQVDQMGASQFVALYATDAAGILMVRALRGQFPEIMRQVRLRPGEGAVGRAVAERRIMIIPFANQAALAIENALLREQSAQAAILAERSRLACGLHDAVTQTLFSASLIAEALPKLWERNSEMGRQKLEGLRLLTRGALSEMRMLLLELRPDTLADVELGDLCRHLTNAFSGRTRVPVTLTQDGQAALPPSGKEAFYRVDQEALNNVAKHADAGQVQLYLALQPERAELVVRNDGAGFDMAALSPQKTWG